MPDNLQANLDVHTSGDSAAAVLTDDNTRTQALLDDLKKAGVSDKDVQTTQLSLNTTYDDHGHVTGYQADDALTVTFRDLKKAGAELDTMVAVAGDAARSESVQFGFNDEDSLTAAAREDAVKRARTQAADMASAAGASLGAVRTITEIVNQPTTVYGPESDAAAGATPSAAVPLAAGTQAVTVQVRVVFALSVIRVHGPVGRVGLVSDTTGSGASQGVTDRYAPKT